MTKKKASHPLTYKRPRRVRTERPVVNAVQGNFYFKAR